MKVKIGKKARALGSRPTKTGNLEDRLPKISQKLVMMNSKEESEKSIRKGSKKEKNGGQDLYECLKGVPKFQTEIFLQKNPRFLDWKSSS